MPAPALLVYFLGDSHAEAIGPRLRSRLSPALEFQAFRGYSTERAHDAAALATGQDLIVISLGGNDYGDQSKARAALVADVRTRNPRAVIVWIGPFDVANLDAGDVRERHDAQAEAQRAQLSALGVRWIDARPWKAKHGPDGVHFTPAGYDALADAIAAQILAPPRRRPTVGRIVAAGIGAAIAGLAFVLRRR